MIKIMQLEIKKAQLGWYVKGAVIANVIILAITALIIFIAQLEVEFFFSDTEEIFIIPGILVRGTFIVFAAVLHVKLVVEEFKNRTIHVMFMYPISRKRLIAAKVLCVVGLTFFTIVLSNVIIMSIVIVANASFQFIAAPITVDMLMGQLVTIVIYAIGATGTSLIPLYFGLRKQSVPVTITSSLVIALLISSHNPVFSIASIIYVPLVLAIVGVHLTLMTVRDVEMADVF
ncbi:ABC-2 family transporter permease [Numidum massiliense]|uniref:hypothetical protein n=1 Tax=Numidum massiliense TaxID=1522315 RepID=UPI0006D56A8D|nr:hypothetical protein [Numidum massiliense]